jgi:hypothetical protein
VRRKHVGGSGPDPIGKARQFKQRRAHGAERVVSEGFDGDDDGPRLYDGGYVDRYRQHLVVVGDQAVPAELIRGGNSLGSFSSDICESISRRLRISGSAGR